ncbi:MAG: lmo0937 family membrane protein [Bacteroidales bacterium]
MHKSLYILSILLVIAWIIGFYSTSIGDIVHIILVMAVIVIIIGVYNDEKLLKKLKIKLK